jgi:hypothetical protein
MRGGRRPRWAPKNELRVYGHGRWGPRRVRTSECFTVIRAEDVYTALLRDDADRVSPGARGTTTWKWRDREATAGWEVRQNAVWRRGRVFLRCPRCLRRCTRVYVPLKTSWPACRRCWGLSYDSRQLLNYKDTLWGRGALARMFATTQRDWAFQATSDKRQERSERARKRWSERQRILRARRRQRSNRTTFTGRAQ